jgi:hypothetical protein
VSWVSMIAVLLSSCALLGLTARFWRRYSNWLLWFTAAFVAGNVVLWAPSELVKIVAEIIGLFCLAGVIVAPAAKGEGKDDKKD